MLPAPLDTKQIQATVAEIYRVRSTNRISEMPMADKCREGHIFWGVLSGEH
jgi:hypothetical protein